MLKTVMLNILLCQIVYCFTEAVQQIESLEWIKPVKLFFRAIYSIIVLIGVCCFHNMK